MEFIVHISENESFGGFIGQLESELHKPARIEQINVDVPRYTNRNKEILIQKVKEDAYIICDNPTFIIYDTTLNNF